MKFEPPARGSKLTTVFQSKLAGQLKGVPVVLVRSKVVHATKRIVLVRSGSSGPVEKLQAEEEGRVWCRGWDGSAVDALKTVLALSGNDGALVKD